SYARTSDRSRLGRPDQHIASILRFRILQMKLSQDVASFRSGDWPNREIELSMYQVTADGLTYRPDFDPARRSRTRLHSSRPATHQTPLLRHGVAPGRIPDML